MTVYKAGRAARATRSASSTSLFSGRTPRRSSGPTSARRRRRSTSASSSGPTASAPATRRAACCASRGRSEPWPTFTPRYGFGLVDPSASDKTVAINALMPRTRRRSSAASSRAAPPPCRPPPRRRGTATSCRPAPPARGRTSPAVRRALPRHRLALLPAGDRHEVPRRGRGLRLRLLEADHRDVDLSLGRRRRGHHGRDPGRLARASAATSAAATTGSATSAASRSSSTARPRSRRPG
jgi:hypothetical protein